MFCKQPLQLSLTGITNDALDLSVVSQRNSLSQRLLVQYKHNTSILTYTHANTALQQHLTATPYKKPNNSTLRYHHLILPGYFAECNTSTATQFWNQRCEADRQEAGMSPQRR